MNNLVSSNKGLQVPQGEMLGILENSILVLAQLINERSLWQSLSIDDENPKTERIWRQLNDIRIYLHKIYPCKKGSAFFHPHPWPSAMYIVAGQYEMGVGHGRDNNSPPALGMTCILTPGCKYEMIHEYGWHYVRPLEQECYTIMVTGKPWDQSLPSSGRSLSCLPKGQFDTLFDFFYNWANKEKEILS